MTRAEAACEALRWVTDAAVAAPGGSSWPETREPDGRVGDDLYDGTAGVLMALAQARLSGITDFDAFADAAAGRLTHLGGADPAGGGRAGQGAADPGDPANPPPDPRRAELYSGLAGYPVALRAWAAAAGDQAAAATADQTIAWLAGLIQEDQPASELRDLITGEAGILLALVTMGRGPETDRAAGWIADRLVAAAQWDGGGPDWTAGGTFAYTMPNFSHGAAGIGFVLAAASGPLGRPDLLDLAAAAGRRLERLGRRRDGTLTVPLTIPHRPTAAPVAYGWCHGAAGTSRLFTLLDQLQPGEGWAGCAAAGRAGILASGLPARLWPGFWDNLGQCCGTAGVGELALDHYQDTGDQAWLDFAGVLAADVLSRAIADRDGVRWSHTEYGMSPPELVPWVGWMQGAAGIAGFLLRLDRVHRDGQEAPRLWWPDRPPPPAPPAPPRPQPQ